MINNETKAHNAIAAAAKSLSSTYTVTLKDDGSSALVEHPNAHFSTYISIRRPDDDHFMIKPPYIYVSRHWRHKHASRILLRDGGYSVRSIVRAVHKQHASCIAEFEARERTLRIQNERKSMEESNAAMARTLSDAVRATGVHIMDISPSPTVHGSVCCRVNGATLTPVQVMAIANIINGV